MRQRGNEGLHPYVAMRANEKSRHRMLRQPSLECSNLCACDLHVLDARGIELSGQGREADRLVAVERNLQRAATLVLDDVGRLGSKALDECVVHREAADGETQQLREVTLDVWGQNSRRGFGCTLADAASIHDVDVCAPGDELVGNGTADDAGPHDRDLHCVIVVRS